MDDQNEGAAVGYLLLALVIVAIVAAPIAAAGV